MSNQSGPAIEKDSRGRTRALATTGEFIAYQRAWFQNLKRQVDDGVPYAVVNADAPHEILRAMGIPYVVNQWWASICAAKQKGPKYFGLLRDRGYPDDQERYASLALASTFEPDDEEPPWGGLPRPELVLAHLTTDATGKIFEVWAKELNTVFYPLESTIDSRMDMPVRWFEHIHSDWERFIGSRRLDLMVAEFQGLIRHLEISTGRQFDEVAFERIMHLANEQMEWNRRARDLIAETTPAPMSVADGIPSVMIPQWHRGTEWGRDAAKRFYEEVQQRVDEGHGAIDDERIRLMWIGRGLWFDMGFYRHFEDTYGAVFVWTMYLAVAADAYARYGDDPLRTLAGRFAGFSDQFNTPPWSSEWYAKEVRHNRIDGVVHLVTDAVRGTPFITRRIEQDGVPVLEIRGSNVDSREWDGDAIKQAVSQFIETRVEPVAAGRRSGSSAAAGRQ